MGFSEFKERRKDAVNRMIKEGIPTSIANKRMTGDTTGTALMAIGNALKSPGTPVWFSDRSQTKQAQDGLVRTIKHILIDLNLEGFMVERMFLIYNLEQHYGDEE